MKLDEARTDPRNIADVLSDRTGMCFTCKDIRNLVAKMRLVARKPSSEELLSVIVDNGGEVKYTKTKSSNDVQVLWLQTKEMKDSLAHEKPTLFQDDTTFGTQEEGFKLNIQRYFSKSTRKWEVAGLILLASETHENVKVGIQYFRNSIPYTLPSGRFIFFLDKDFDYINVFEEILLVVLSSFVMSTPDAILKKRYLQVSPIGER